MWSYLFPMLAQPAKKIMPQAAKMRIRLEAELFWFSWFVGC